MRKEEIIKEAKEIEEDLEESVEKRNPIWYIIAVFLALIVVVMIIPISGIDKDSRPQHIPDISEVFDKSMFNDSYEFVYSQIDYKYLMRPDQIKPVADKLVSISCSEYSRVCYAKAIFLFTRDKFSYVNDPLEYDFIKSAPYSLSSGAGDCDDASILQYNLLEAVGIDARFVFIPGHVYIQAKLPEALNKYKSDGDWVNMDATCTNCDFGEIPYSNLEKDKRYLE